MSEVRSGSTPRLEVRVLRDGIVVQRELCESPEEADAVVEAWSDAEGIVCEVVDLVRDHERDAVLEPRPWEVDADDAFNEDVTTEEELR